jgi:dipeptidase E
MKLYLSSYRVPAPDELISLLGKPASSVELAIIPNARDYNSMEERTQGLEELATYFRAMGYKVTFVDLRECAGAEELYDKLKQYDLIWACGGNTFILRYEMKRSGFDEAVRKLLDEGKVYGGDSAGAIVAGASLKGFELADDPELAQSVIWDGMQLIEKTIMPHADSPDFTAATDEVRKNYPSEELIVLNDNQAFVVDGARQEIVAA